MGERERRILGNACCYDDRPGLNGGRWRHPAMLCAISLSTCKMYTREIIFDFASFLFTASVLAQDPGFPFDRDLGRPHVRPGIVPRTRAFFPCVATFRRSAICMGFIGRVARAAVKSLIGTGG